LSLHRVRTSGTEKVNESLNLAKLQVRASTQEGGLEFSQYLQRPQAPAKTFERGFYQQIATTGRIQDISIQKQADWSCWLRSTSHQ
jgi:hypothetical protein